MSPIFTEHVVLYKWQRMWSELIEVRNRCPGHWDLRGTETFSLKSSYCQEKKKARTRNKKKNTYASSLWGVVSTNKLKMPEGNRRILACLLPFILAFLLRSPDINRNDFTVYESVTIFVDLSFVFSQMIVEGWDGLA